MCRAWWHRESKMLHTSREAVVYHDKTSRTRVPMAPSVAAARVVKSKNQYRTDQCQLKLYHFQMHKDSTYFPRTRSDLWSMPGSSLRQAQLSHPPWRSFATVGDTRATHFRPTGRRGRLASASFIASYLNCRFGVRHV